MPESHDDLARTALRREWSALSDVERRVLDAVRHRATVSHDPLARAQDRRTLGERLADRIAAFGGSWTFILLFLASLVGWAVLNTEILGPRHAAFDPYPYVFLNLMLSMLAALQAPIIMMSQNRQAAKDREQAAQDYEVNLKAEVEIRALHDKLDLLREAQWAELVRQQEEQIRLLQALLRERSGGSPAAG